jgi:hypothetical protein
MLLFTLLDRREDEDILNRMVASIPGILEERIPQELLQQLLRFISTWFISCDDWFFISMTGYEHTEVVFFVLVFLM